MKRKAPTPPTPRRGLLLVGSGEYGQATVDDSPGYKCVVARRRKRGILVLDHDTLEEVEFLPLQYHVHWLTCSPFDSTRLYASGDDDKLHSLQLSFDKKYGSVEIESLSEVDSLGGSAYVEYAHEGGHLLVANYGSGVIATFPVHTNGRLFDATDSKQPYPLDGLDPELDDRQEACHPHQVVLDPSGKWALVCDLGADRVWVYAFVRDGNRASLVGAVNSPRHLKLPAGSGPRHLAFHPSGKHVYVLCELSGELVPCSWANGELVALPSALSVMPEGRACARAHHSGTSHVAVHPSGSHVYAASRTDNQIVVFDCRAAAKLKWVQRVSTRGVCPRHFLVDDTALTLGNQDTSTLVRFPIQSDGKLADARATVVETTGLCPNVLCAMSLAAK